MQNIKQSMRATWMAGNFGEIAKNTARIAEEFVSRLAVRPGVHALDIACGSGNVAIPMARTGAIVTGVDIAPNLLAQGRERAAAESLIVNFDEDSRVRWSMRALRRAALWRCWMSEARTGQGTAHGPHRAGSSSAHSARSR